MGAEPTPLTMGDGSEVCPSSILKLHASFSKRSKPSWRKRVAMQSWNVHGQRAHSRGGGGHFSPSRGVLLFLDQYAQDAMRTPESRVLIMRVKRSEEKNSGGSFPVSPDVSVTYCGDCLAT